MEQNVQLKDSIQVMTDNQVEDIYTFRFDTNEDAMIYWENKGFRIDL